LYFSEENTLTPDSVEVWQDLEGNLPLPSVISGACP
jgi:hypothetical protein